MKKTGLSSLGAAGLALGILFFAFTCFGENASRPPHFDHSQLTITRADGKRFSFKMKVATSEQEQARGLMFVRSMQKDQGMIFPMIPPRPVFFWMKNTLIPLDMLFVSPDGTLGWIESEARPQDETPIYSQGAVSAVIEINGGLAKKYGLSAGDKVDSPALKTE